MGKEQLEQLEEHGTYLSCPNGISMRPMIRGGRDVVLVEKLTRDPVRYDLVMYVRPDLQGVIHRVVRFENGKYIIIGDNCWQYEYVNPDQIKGIVTEFCHKGKWHKVDEKFYKLYVHAWVDLVFIKRPVFYVRDKIKRKLKKMKR